MGMKDWINGMKKKAEERLNPAPADPETARKKKREDNEKNFKRTAEAIKLAKKAIEVVGKASDKADEISKDIAGKTIDIADKVGPLAERVDGAIDSATGAVKKALRRSDDDAPEAETEIEPVADTPAAEEKASIVSRVKETTSEIAAKTSGTLGATFETVKDKTADGIKAAGDGLKSVGDAAGKAIDEAKEANAKKPSSGSSLLDMIAPVIPETEATRPKKPADKDAPPQP